MSLTQKQVKRLITPVRSDRVENLRGNTYVPHHEVRAELSRIFGPGNWDSTVHDVTLLYEDSRPGTGDKADKTYWTVGYRAAVTLRVRDYYGNHVAEFTEYHAEENAPQPNRGEAHALCLTSVESYALRRAAIGLGDSFGLHLYADGSLAPLIRGTLMLEEVFGIDPRSGAASEALTDEKRQVLESSLGAQIVAEEGAEAPGNGTSAEREGAEATA